MQHPCHFVCGSIKAPFPTCLTLLLGDCCPRKQVYPRPELIRCSALRFGHLTDACSRSAQTWQAHSLLATFLHLMNVRNELIITRTRASGSTWSRIVLIPTRVSIQGFQENQVHSITLEAQKVPNLDFEPIPSYYKVHTIVTWHPCTFNTKIWTTVELAEN